MGGIETSNLDVRIDRRDSWTQLVFSQAMPAAAVSYDLAADNITAERVIDDQLPELAPLASRRGHDLGRGRGRAAGHAAGRAIRPSWPRWWTAPIGPAPARSSC